MPLTTLQVVSVPVSDVDKAKEFYADQLGFTVTADNQFGGGMRWLMLAPPGGGTGITLVTWFESMPPGSLKGLVLGCEDLETSLAELGGHGVSFHEDEIAEAPWGRWKTFDDPDGNTWVLQQTRDSFG